MRIDAGQDVLEVIIWIDVVQLAGADEAVEDGGGFSAASAPYEEMIFPSNDQRSDCVLDGLSKCLDKPSYPGLFQMIDKPPCHNKSLCLMEPSPVAMTD